MSPKMAHSGRRAERRPKSASGPIAAALVRTGSPWFDRRPKPTNGCYLPTEMTAHHLISLLAISLLSTAEAKAGAAPQQLQGKSITLSWSETGVFKRDGSSVSKTYNVVRVIYISQAGRAFIRGTTAGRGGGMTKEAGPEQTS